MKDGDIVVALVDGSDATLKRFYREPDGCIRLQPANCFDATNSRQHLQHCRYRAAY